MAKQGMLAEIDKSKVPNFKNIDPAVLARAKDYDPGNKYSVPYYMGAAGVAVNKTKVKQYEHSWSIFSRKDLKDKMTMLDDMREVMGDALAFQGKSVNTPNEAEIKAAEELVNKTWKPNLLKFDAEAFAKGFAAGEFWVAQGYAENIFAEYDATKRGEVDFFIPKEGGPLYIDSMVVLKNSKSRDLALKFIDFIHRPEIYAEFCDAFGFPATANVPARALKKGDQWYKAEDLAKCELKLVLGADLEKYNAAWQEIKVGKYGRVEQEALTGFLPAFPRPRPSREGVASCRLRRSPQHLPKAEPRLMRRGGGDTALPRSRGRDRRRSTTSPGDSRCAAYRASAYAGRPGSS